MNAPTGKQLAEAGIQQATDSADQINEGWSEHAYLLLQQFLKRRKRRDQFKAEEVYAWAYQRGLPRPLDGRAWGGVVQRAARAGLIEKRGYAPVQKPSGHCRPAHVWGRV